MPKDPFIREKFTKERSAARKFAQEFFERYPKEPSSKAGARSNLTTRICYVAVAGAGCSNLNTIERSSTAKAEGPKANLIAGHVSVAPPVSGVAPCATGPRVATW
jgi:hypothetical protein